jgi:hypothetical protein
MFRFDQEDRLVRAVGLLAEVRQWRDSQRGLSTKRAALKPTKATPTSVDARGLDLSDKVCRLVAAVAAHPVACAATAISSAKTIGGCARYARRRRSDPGHVYG